MLSKETEIIRSSSWSFARVGHFHPTGSLWRARTSNNTTCLQVHRLKTAQNTNVASRHSSHVTWRGEIAFFWSFGPYPEDVFIGTKCPPLAFLQEFSESWPKALLTTPSVASPPGLPLSSFDYICFLRLRLWCGTKWLKYWNQVIFPQCNFYITGPEQSH